MYSIYCKFTPPCVCVTEKCKIVTETRESHDGLACAHCMATIHPNNLLMVTELRGPQSGIKPLPQLTI